MDFMLQMGRLLAIFGVQLSNFFLCGLLLSCVLPWVICFMFGVAWVSGFCVVLSFCTELLWIGGGGDFEQLAAINCFLEYLGGPTSLSTENMCAFPYIVPYPPLPLFG